MAKWEYMIITLDAYTSEEELNKLGLNGWELVSVTPETANDYVKAYLKRQIKKG